MPEQIHDLNIPSSFRDPSGFIFLKDGLIHRHVNNSYKDDYDFLFSSGLYDVLVESALLIPHEEINEQVNLEKAYKIIKPKLIPFISYPHEWCFSQLKNAALTTLEIQKKAINHGMTLKDCSAYNIQFRKGKPIFIDTLSFEKYKEGQPWVAYKQFCQHFLAPLALMSKVDIRLNQLFRVYIDGVPLDLASSLLPIRTYLKFTLLSHIHLHSKSQKHYANKNVVPKEPKISRFAFLGLIDSLYSAVKKLKWHPQVTEWGDYYDKTNYCTKDHEFKKQTVSRFVDKINPKNIWDLGANTGVFSRIASDKGVPTVSFDIDPVAVEKNYLECMENKETNILPLLLDLTNPSPSIGWQNQERMSFLERGPADMVFALALIHHLAISNNLPFEKIAKFFSKICNFLIIEFVLKNDSQIQRLLSTRKDIFHNYTQREFEREFEKYFIIHEIAKIGDSMRIIYLMEKK